MSVEIVDGVHWIGACTDVGGRHMHVAVFLIRTGEAAILVDTGAVHHTDAVVTEIDRLTGGAGVDTLVLSHPDLPHSGNVPALRATWPDLELVVFSNTPPIHGFAEATKGERGGDMTIAGRRFSWIDAPLADVTSTAWVYDHDADVLFTADGFGHYHDAETCGEPGGIGGADVPYEDVRDFNRDVLPWLQYVDPPKLERTLAGLLDDLDPTYIGPVHGVPLPAEGIDRYLAQFTRSVEEIAAGYEFPADRA